MLDLLAGGKEPSTTSPRGGFGPLMDRSRDLGYRDGKTDKDIDALFDCVSRFVTLSFFGCSFKYS